MKSHHRTLEWRGGPDGYLRLLDQTLLPGECRYVECRDVQTVWEAIRSLRVRGAPAIGVAAAYGVVLAAEPARDAGELLRKVRQAADYLRTSRPTAVNLFWALERIERAARASGTGVPPVPARAVTSFTATRRNLPLWQSPGSTYFVTWKTASEMRLSPAERTIVLDAIRHWDGTRWEVLVAVVMPDHVHLLVHPLAASKDSQAFHDLGALVHSVKSYSSHKIARVSNKRPVWQDERYDRIVRDEKEFWEKWQYIRDNPVAASLAPTAEEYPWFYQASGLEPRHRRDAGATDADLLERMKERLLAEARAIEEEDRAMCAAIGRHGAELLADGTAVMTHCNAGSLATAGDGTAEAVFYAAHAAGKRLHVYATETRPLWQGARLTTWELTERGLPVTLLCDSAAACVMQQGRVRAVVTGADRIAANGDVANKIGTYALALAARAHGIPFYVAAPSSTIDLAMADGSRIPIEERDPREITHPFGRPIAPEGTAAYNPAFDVTPAELVSAIITERGIIRPVNAENVRRMLA